MAWLTTRPAMRSSTEITITPMMARVEYVQYKLLLILEERWSYGYTYDAEGRRVAKGTVNPAPLGQSSSCNSTNNGFTLTERQ
jgi:hypothetical protein